MALIKIEPYIIDATGDFTFNNVTATGNLSSLNANLGNLATANFFIGSGANLTNLPAGNISGQVANALVSGTVYTASQPNITSVGTLTGLTSNGVVNFANTSNTTLGAVGNVRITGGSSGQYLQTDGSGTLTWATVSSGSTSNISNGNSNVNIPAANGNVNISSAGNANILVITGTGANITGTLNVTGNTTVGNLLSSGSGGNITNANVISANTFTASGNITAGNANLGNSVTANYFIGNFYGTANSATTATSATTAGTVTTAAQPNITSTGTLTSLSVSGTGSFGGNVNLNSFNITSLATPVASTDAATKQYVDDVAQGLNVHDSVAAATTTTLATITSGTITYNNGSSGVGANLTTTGTFNLIDGVNVQTSGTRILVKNEANAVFNGIYTWSNATVITRATDYNSVPEVEAGDFVFCTGGTTYDNTGWVQTSTVTAIGTTGNNIEFTQFSGAGTYQAGTGLTLTGSTFSVNASQTQITSVGTLGNLTVTGNATVGNLVTSGSGGTLSNINVVSANTFTASGNITAGNANLGNNVTANFFTGNGVYLTGITTAGLSNGNSNVNIPAANGNINFTAVGNTTMIITGTGANIAGTANISGNLSAGNIIAGSGSGGNITNANVISANTFTASGNITAGNANLGNAVTANYFIGSGANLTNLSAGNISGQVANALIAGTVYTASQPNITSVGTLTGLTSNGIVNFANTSNVTLGAVGNVRITGGSSGQYLQTDGSGTLTWATVSSGSTSNISNGNSNVNIPAANGNVNISAVGNANILVITGTGANITGTANISGNLSAGNIIAGSGSGGNITNANVISANTFTASGNITAGNATLGNAVTANYFIGNFYGTANSATTAGTVTTAAQPNITSVGSLTGLTVSNATGIVDFTTTANVTLGAVANLHISGGTNAYVLSTDGAGNLSWVAQSGGGGGGSSISNGNSNISIATANGNITMSAVGNANIVTVTGTGVNVAGTLNVTGQSNLGAVGNVKITGGTANYLLSTDGAGNLSWTAPPAGANVTVDNFTGNGVQTIFTLSTTPTGINQTSVNYNGATVLRTDYTLANANITFSSAPANGSLIEITTINLTSSGGGGTSTAAAVGYSLIFGG